jgi:hypothetical protein
LRLARVEAGGGSEPPLAPNATAGRRAPSRASRRRREIRTPLPRRRLEHGGRDEARPCPRTEVGTTAPTPTSSCSRSSRPPPSAIPSPPRSRSAPRRPPTAVRLRVEPPRGGAPRCSLPAPPSPPTSAPPIPPPPTQPISPTFDRIRCCGGSSK